MLTAQKVQSFKSISIPAEMVHFCSSFAYVRMQTRLFTTLGLLVLAPLSLWSWIIPIFGVFLVSRLVCRAYAILNLNHINAWFLDHLGSLAFMYCFIMPLWKPTYL
ncbi:hypothetical protein BX070DRAFT_225488 [Coemansia spiralis]|nr:hypothetical protein BX070DRAFT_225488 [Coemansia spiralis]